MVVQLNGVSLDRDLLREAGIQRQEAGPRETASSGQEASGRTGAVKAGEGWNIVSGGQD